MDCVRPVTLSLVISRRGPISYALLHAENRDTTTASEGEGKSNLDTGTSQCAAPNWAVTGRGGWSTWTHSGHHLEFGDTGRTHPSPSQIAQLRQFLPLPGRSTSTSRESDTRAALSEGPAAFGAWLSKTRALRQMTVPELAERSGVSAVAIYNLEGGRTTNPRRQTQASLSKALGQSPPAEVEEQAQQSAGHFGIGRPRGL